MVEENLRHRIKMAKELCEALNEERQVKYLVDVIFYSFNYNNILKDMFRGACSKLNLYGLKKLIGSGTT